MDMNSNKNDAQPAAEPVREERTPARALEAWLKWIAEEQRYRRDPDNHPRPNSGLLCSDLRPETNIRKARPDGGFIYLTVENAYDEGRCNPALVAFLRLATAFMGTVGFNANSPGKNEGKGLHYPEFRIGKYFRINIGRLLADAGPGETFVEPEDHYDWTIQSAGKKSLADNDDAFVEWQDAPDIDVEIEKLIHEAHAGDPPGKAWRTREDAIQAALAAYDKRAGRSGLSISRNAYEEALRSCLKLLDGDRAAAGARPTL